MSSCQPKVTTKISKSYPVLNYDDKVEVIGVGEVEPKNAEILGQVKIGDTGFSTKCDYDIVINKAKLEARKVGGNAIKIINHRPPSPMGSTCHRITAKILNIEDIDNYQPATEEEETLLDVDYAILNVYRYGGRGSLMSYDLYLGDSILCRVRNNFKTTLRIKKDGLNSLWAKTEKKAEVSIDVEIGKTYYLRCGVSIGVLVGRPQLELIDGKTGKTEFETFEAKNQ